MIWRIGREKNPKTKNEGKWASETCGATTSIQDTHGGSSRREKGEEGMNKWRMAKNIA